MSGAMSAAGMNTAIAQMAIRGMVSAVPGRCISNAAFEPQFGAAAVADIAKMTGVQSRRHTNSQQTAADLCQAAANTLLDELGWERQSVDAVIFISQTPDYRLPASACQLQHQLGLRPSCAAFDVNLGCSGYVYGLWLAGKLLDGVALRRVLLLVGDTISKIVNPADRATALLFGDAGSATALEFDAAAPMSHFVLGSDGAGARNLIIPQGGARVYLDDDARLAAADPRCLYMDGAEVFNFTLSHVAPLVTQLLAFAGVSKEAVDLFAFHQANSFMLRHIIKKLKLDPLKAPLNMERYGNTSCASIPLLITDAATACRWDGQVAMIGFGVGYSWAAALLNLGSMQVNALIEI